MAGMRSNVVADWKASGRSNRKEAVKSNRKSAAGHGSIEQMDGQGV